MRNSEARLIGEWAKIEYSDIDEINSIGVDELQESTKDEPNMFVTPNKKNKRTRHNDIVATFALLSGHEIDVETSTVFGKRIEKEFVTQPLRSIESHEAKVKEMEKIGYAFDPMAINNQQIDEPDKFSERELAPVAQMIFGIINEMENKRSIHKRAR